MEKTLSTPAAGLSKVKLLVMTGLLAALGCMATMVLRVPSPTGGYMNLGDTVVLLGAYLLGPVYGAVAGGMGPMMADILSGYAVYAPATLVIKAIMGLVAGWLYRVAKDKTGGVLLTGIVGEIPMVVGYWLFDALLLGSFAGSAAGLPSNFVQAAFGVAVSTILVLALRKSSYVRREFPNL
ncbi:MAG: ECF transporter S component [Oscillibacter sp.]